jgi:hypothetical protein
MAAARQIARCRSRQFAGAVFLGFCLGLCGQGLHPAAASAANIEAVKGKRYSLSDKHGPWMIMVTTLNGATREQQDRAMKAADELVHELRLKGIPAYVYAQEAKIERIKTLNRLGQEDRRVFAAQRNDIGILAGNYDSVDDKVAQRTLKFIKEFRPAVLEKAGVGSQSKGAGPLNKAFLTANPMLSQVAFAAMVRAKDPLIAKLNSGVDNSLLSNPGKYSLVVASFYGKSQVKPTRFADFEKNLAGSEKLDQAGMDAWQLCQAMRQQKLEAWVYHDRFRSIVTVGSFDTATDPRIEKHLKAFSAKYKKHPETGKDVLVSEAIQIMGGNGKTPLKNWVMDPYPQVIEVPKVGKAAGK